MNLLRRFVLPLGVVLAALLSAASGAAAQGRRTSISDAELRRSGAERLHDAIAQLRPDWLLMAGDPADPASAEQIVVYLDGRHVGDLRALRGIHTAEVRSVRLHGAEYVRRADPMFPRREFVAALFVATMNRAAQAPREGRVTVSLHGGLNLVGIAKSVESELHAQGYIQRSTYVGFEAFGFDERDRAIPPAAGGSVHVGLRGALAWSWRRSTRWPAGWAG